MIASNSIQSMVVQMTNMERIATTPIPVACASLLISRDHKLIWTYRRHPLEAMHYTLSFRAPIRSSWRFTLEYDPYRHSSCLYTHGHRRYREPDRNAIWWVLKMLWHVGGWFDHLAAQEPMTQIFHWVCIVLDCANFSLFNLFYKITFVPR